VFAVGHLIRSQVYLWVGRVYIKWHWQSFFLCADCVDIVSSLALTQRLVLYFFLSHPPLPCYTFSLGHYVFKSVALHLTLVSAAALPTDHPEFLLCSTI